MYYVFEKFDDLIYKKQKCRSNLIQIVYSFFSRNIYLLSKFEQNQ